VNGSDPGLKQKNLAQNYSKTLTNSVRPLKSNKVLHLVKPEISNRYKTYNRSLPVALTSFIGRKTELEAVCQLINTPAVRLVTIFGTAGLGKTRLSLAVGEKLQNQFPDGVFFVSLAHLTKPDEGLAAIAQALGLPYFSQLPVQEKLQNYLKNRVTVLILDNFEQIVELGSAISELLAVTSQLKIIVTSRSALHLYGEYVYHLAPLDVVEVSQVPSFEKLCQNEAVTLFSQRATMVNPHFELTPANAVTVARLCLYLEGLPLAIELAAARCDVFSPLALLERLKADQRFKMLAGGFANLPPRQRTLAGALEWSYQLLSAPEKQLFRRLGLFTGSFSLEALEVVSQETTATLEIAVALLNKSLLIQVDARPGETLRFTMLETIREYALEKLAEAGELETAKAAYIGYFSEMAATGAAHLKNPGNLNWLKRLKIDHSNILNALNYLVEDSEVEGAFRLGGSLWPVWSQWGYLAQGREWLDKLLTLERQNLEEPLLAGLLNGAAYLALYQSDYGSARLYFEESIQICRQAGASKCLGTALSGLAELYRIGGNHEKALQLNYECLELFRFLGEEIEAAGSLCNIAWQLLERGEYQEIQALLEEALDIYSKASYQAGMARAKTYLGDFQWRKNNPTQAVTSLEEAIALARPINYRLWLPEGLGRLGLIYLCEGQLILAKKILEESIELAEEMRKPLDLSYAYSNLGLLKLVQNDLAGAESLFRQALNLRSEIGQLEGVLWAMEGLAVTTLKQANYGPAQQMMEESQLLREALNVPVLPHTIKFILPVFLNFTSIAKADAAPLKAKSIVVKNDTAVEAVSKLVDDAASGDWREAVALSKRENEVLKLLAQGYRTNEIARILVVSPGTVNNHLNSIYSKFEVNSRTAAIRYALDHSLL
jgi:predicted ATPase/DNA-binding CsgD family transcriptional regulator